MMRKLLEIRFDPPYPIHVGENILTTELINFCKACTARLVIVTDSNLLPTWGKRVQTLLTEAGVQVDLLSIPAGEAHKTRATKAMLEDALFAKGYGRDTCLIALGGGTVTDLVGFVAATYCRGIKVLYAPTTLLAMVDASIGGKTGVDTPFGKNLVGAFYQPAAVFMDLAVLESLPEAEWKNGVVEMLKHGIIADQDVFRQLTENADRLKDKAFLLEMIFTSCEIKRMMIETDERDFGKRQLLNFGHTIGHALETLEHYCLSHGEAVAIGMMVEAKIAALSGFLREDAVAEIEAALRTYHLPLKTSAFGDLEALKKVLRLDKKAARQTAQFVLLSEIGRARQAQDQYVFQVAPDLLNDALLWAKERFS